MKTLREFVFTVLLAGVCLAIILTISRPLLIPPGASNVTSIGWGWREFDYKDSRYIQSPIGYMAPVRDDKAALDKAIDLIEHAGKRITE